MNEKMKLLLTAIIEIRDIAATVRERGVEPEDAMNEVQDVVWALEDVLEDMTGGSSELPRGFRFALGKMLEELDA